MLIDGHALVYRAFFAMPALTNSRGEITNAAFGFTSMLLKALTDLQPAYAVACFDPPGPTFRHEEFKDYKATRAAMPDDLRPQLPWCREIIDALHIPSVELPRYEADDVIGSLSRQGVEKGCDVVVVTGDIDMLQLVNPHVRIFINRRGITETIIYDEAAVFERFGFPPPMVADYKALQGDSTDNIPGIPGVGTKTAMSLIQQYGPLEEILKAIPGMKPGKLTSSLQEHAEQAKLSKRMATIRSDIDVPLDLDHARVGGYDDATVKQLFDRLEFRSLLPRLPAAFGAMEAAQPLGQADLFGGEAPPASADVVLIRNEKDALSAVAELRASKRFSLRSVIAGVPRNGELAGAAVAGDGKTYYFTNDAAVIAVLEGVLGDAGTTVDGYDLKREILFWGPKLRAALGCDLMLAAYLESSRTRVPTIPVLVHDLLGMEIQPEEELFKSGRQKLTAADLSAEQLAAYYGQWVSVVPALRDKLIAELQKSNLMKLHDELEVPLVPILAEMERAGIAADCDLLARLSKELHQRIEEIEEEIQDIAGYSFNPGSTQQLARFLYTDLNLAAGKKTKTGLSTDAESLEALRGEHPAVNLILEWRQLTKLKSTYVDALPLLCDARSRIHTSFNQAVAATGRLSSADPNLQNVPIRTEWGQRIRRAFVADKGMMLVSADYSQVELRVLAHVSGEDELIASFARNEDIHRRTAAEVYGIAPEAVTPDMRRIAKVVNFGVLYGLSDFGLSRDTGMPREEAKKFIDAYFANFPKVTAWLEETRQHARQWGWVETFNGRRRYIPDIRAANRQIRMAAERMAVNMPIQGGAADIIKKAMIDCDRAMKASNSRSRLLLQVHDELVFETPEDDVDEFVPLVRDAMSKTVQLAVPLVVDVKVGRNWQEMTPVPEAVSANA